jgi:hypothetical protein
MTKKQMIERFKFKKSMTRMGLESHLVFSFYVDEDVKKDSMKKALIERIDSFIERLNKEKEWLNKG